MNKKERQEALNTCLELLQDESETLESVLARFPEAAQVIRPELEAVLEAAAWLEERKRALEPRPGFVVASRQRLSARIRAARPASPARLWLSGLLAQRATILRFAAVLLLVASLLLNGYQAVQATFTCLPGDLVYPVKIALENTRLAFTVEPAANTRLHIEFAHLRLLEVQALIFEGRYERLPATVANFEGHVQKAVAGTQRLSASDLDQAQALATDLHKALDLQTSLVMILASFAPQQIQPQFERIRAISEQSIAELQDLLLPSSGQVRDRAVGAPAGDLTDLLGGPQPVTSWFFERSQL